jgi:hypothetical protein
MVRRARVAAAVGALALCGAAAVDVAGRAIDVDALAQAGGQGTAVAPVAQAVQDVPLAPDVAALLKGAIDIHVHSLPDDRPRSIDAVDVAMLARTRGMRAIVLKNHYESTAGVAFLVRKLVPGIEVFGGIDLNRTVGGINPAPVEHMVKVTGGWGRVVWMPTFDAENQVRFSKEARPFVSVSRAGSLLPEVVQVIRLIAQHNLVLATGHSSASEGILLLEVAKRAGVTRMVVTHAMNDPIAMDGPTMQRAVELGAFIEFVGGSMREAGAGARVARFAQAIRALGPDRVILSSDLGQAGNALPPDGFGAFLAAIRAQGFSEAHVARMSRENPARLLGLP